MDKIRLHQILSVLLLPYRERSFFHVKEDMIANYRHSLAKLKHRNKLSLKEQQEYEKKYTGWQKELETFLIKHPTYYIHTIDDFKMLIDLFYPEEECVCLYQTEEEERLEQIDQIYFHNLIRIAESLLTFRDGRIAMRTWNNDGEDNDIFDYPSVFDKVEIWNLLGRMICTDVIIAAFFVKCGLEDVFYLYHQTGGILLADKVLEKVMKQGLAETHMHMTAGLDFLYYWQEKMDLRNVGEKEQGYETTIGYAIYRTLWAEYLEQEKVPTFKTYVEKKDGKQTCNLLQAIYETGNCKAEDDGRRISSEIWKRWKAEYGFRESSEEFLFATIYQFYRKLQTYSELIMLQKSFVYFRKHPEKTDELHLFLQYVRKKNICYGEIVQSNQIVGLTNFRKIFGNMRKETGRTLGIEKGYDTIFQSISNNIYLKKLELRIPPFVDMQLSEQYYQYSAVKKNIRYRLLEEILQVLQAYQKYILHKSGFVDCEVTKMSVEQYLQSIEEEKSVAIPAIGIIFHFTKKDFVDNRIGDFCWMDEKQYTGVKSKHLRIWREAMVETALAIEELRSTIPLLGEYVVGIDATSEENKTEPWIFAPVYSAIRNKYTTKPVLMTGERKMHSINNMGFTYHVGEEFRHLLSGLRHIDEVITHFHYKSGDRLGHALALGIDIEYWMDKNEVVVIPILEHMENLIWIWGKLVRGEWNIEMSAEVLEGKILELAKQIYGNIHGMTVHMLYDAYIEKFKLNYEKIFATMRGYLRTEQHGETHDKWRCDESRQGHFCKLYDTTSPYGILWTVEKIFCTYFCPSYYAKFQKPIFVKVNKEELPMLQKIQDYMIRDIERLGIYVETNPTSNLAIGEIKQLYSEPLLKLNSRGLMDNTEEKHEVLVTINSDDPIIFNTSSENELAYIYHALTYHGYKKESVLKWINKVRQMGLDSSFVKEYKDPYQQYCEIKTLVEEIERVLRKVR